jgi:hypothetical protein
VISEFKRIYLCLFAGVSNQPLPKGLTDTNQSKPNQVSFENRRVREGVKQVKKSRDWILQKKERQRKQGK